MSAATSVVIVTPMRKAMIRRGRDIVNHNIIIIIIIIIIISSSSSSSS